MEEKLNESIQKPLNMLTPLLRTPIHADREVSAFHEPFLDVGFDERLIGHHEAIGFFLEA